jgi:hypothetical protein
LGEKKSDGHVQLEDLEALGSKHDLAIFGYRSFHTLAIFGYRSIVSISGYTFGLAYWI